MKSINVAIVGVGNCASALVQGVHSYAQSGSSEGLMHKSIGGYTVQDINFVGAFDVDERKIGLQLSEAIFRGPNCCYEFWDKARVMNGDPVVRKAHIMDGVADHMRTSDPYDEERFYATDDVQGDPSVAEYASYLREAKANVLLNYLPVGSEQASKFWAQVCIEAGVAMVNCIPVFIASDPIWAKKFIDAGVVIVGDDMRSMVGASIISAVLQDLFLARGADVTLHYQDNVGGNTDFYNMQDKGRLASKKTSKENVIRNQNKLAGVGIKENSIHAGPACYFPSLGDNKRAHWLIKGTIFGGAPFEFTADLTCQDSPNSAGVVIDAIRYAQTAKNLGIVGPLVGPSAWTQKTPPVDMKPADARLECDLLAKAVLPNDYIVVGDSLVHKSFAESV